MLNTFNLYITCIYTYFFNILNRMKQMYGDLFHDICVYSDVCNLLAEHHYHIQARRYMHELFLDAPFKEVDYKVL